MSPTRLASSSRSAATGDEERNHIYAEAFSKDKDFFAFYRSMQAYDEALKGSHTRIVLSPSSEFFRYFNAPSGKTGAGAAGAEGAR